ncbi:Light-inducible protein CPRF2 [Apostasia shenzhenica]|uniref:Light-inducible protein CPRF2 n=1 Tax=Apostasia shenzhenica TaxID=1088818 RepID=A0A2I0B6C8_9ASPA|nr:Light-inducible protein CPRF2 [Apostasia shenzhenica]
MERVFSVEEMQDPFWAPSPAASGVSITGIGGGGGSVQPSAMNRSASMWFFEKFLEEEAAAVSEASSAPAVADPNQGSNGIHLPNRDPKPGPSSHAPFPLMVRPSVRKDGGGGGEDEVVEIKGPHPPAASQLLLTEPSASDPEEYAAFLKQKLDLYCAAVAKSWGSGVIPQDSPLVESMSLLSDSSQLGSEAPHKGMLAGLIFYIPVM